MPFVRHGGVRIHYEVEGDGAPLVLAHGLSMELRSWRSLGYAAALRDSHRLVMIDARGHGESDKPHREEEYALATMAGDVLAVLADLGVERAHYWGYSMGGNIGFALMEQAPERFGAFIIGGASPYRKREERRDIAPLFAAMRERGIAGFLEESERLMGRVPSRRRSVLEASDPQALVAAYYQQLAEPGCAHILPGVENPCLLYAGEGDPRYVGAQAGAALLPRGEFLSLPGLDHNTAHGRGDLIVPKVRDLLGRSRL